MRTEPICVPCFIRGAQDTAKLLGLSQENLDRFVREAGRLAAAHNPAFSPPVLGQQIQRCLRALAGPDPYATIKAQSNALAWRLLPDITRLVATAADPFEAALRYAIAGNVIDFGKGHGIGEPEVLATLERFAAIHLDAALVARVHQLCTNARSIVVLTDNAGEIVFDRLLLERLPGKRVTIIVRGSPVINDATLADAEVAKLSEFATVIANGSDAPGTLITDLSEPAYHALTHADLVIAKGQGNFESLDPGPHDHLHLLLVKCPLVATQIGLAQGSPAIIHHPGMLSHRLGLTS